MSTQLRLDLADRPERALVAPSFFVRSHMTVAEVAAGEAQGRAQESAILSWFRAQPAGERFTPSFVAAAFLCWPVTSIRRAITNATRKGLLVHWPGDRRPGPLGAKESTWSLPA